MKLGLGILVIAPYLVAPLAGAWIETVRTNSKS